MRTKKVKGHRLSNEHIVLGIYTPIGYAALEKPMNVREVVGESFYSALQGKKGQTYIVSHMDGDGMKQLYDARQFTAYDDQEYKVLVKF